MKHHFPAIQRLPSLTAFAGRVRAANEERAHEHEHAITGLLFGAVIGSFMWVVSLATFVSLRA